VLYTAVLGWRCCVPHLLPKVEQLSGPLERRHQYVVLGQFTFKLVGDYPATHAVVPQPGTYWVGVDDLSDHGDPDVLINITDANLEEIDEELTPTPEPATSATAGRRKQPSRGGQ
jgi:hypothetical protein